MLLLTNPAARAAAPSILTGFIAGRKAALEQELAIHGTDFGGKLHSSNSEACMSQLGHCYRCVRYLRHFRSEMIPKRTLPAR